MRNLAKICAVVAICLSASGNSLARGGPGLDLSVVSLSVPFLASSMQRMPLRVGRISGSARKQLDTKATTRVSANNKSGLDLSKVDLSAPFVALSMPRTPLRLGEMVGPGLKELGATVEARVVANCRWSLMASFEGLTHEAGRVAILPKHMVVEINGKEVPVGTERVRIASSGSTNLSDVDVPIELKVKVKGSAAYPAGRYLGNLVVAVMAVP